MRLGPFDLHSLDIAVLVADHGIEGGGIIYRKQQEIDVSGLLTQRNPVCILGKPNRVRQSDENLIVLANECVGPE